MYNKFSCLSVHESDSTPVNVDGTGEALRVDGAPTHTLRAPQSRDGEAQADTDQPPKPVKHPMVWIDLEMTGVVPQELFKLMLRHPA
jgi:hypothetical protein